MNGEGTTGLTRFRLTDGRAESALLLGSVTLPKSGHACLRPRAVPFAQGPGVPLVPPPALLLGPAAAAAAQADQELCACLPTTTCCAQ